MAFNTGLTMQTNPPAAFDDLPPVKMLETPQGRQIAYRERPGKAGESDAPTVLYLHGYASDMMATKARFFDQRCAERGQAFVRFDCSGNGQSPGDLANGTLSRWIEDALAIIDHVITGSVVLVGSSMGGWIALHCARQRPDRIKALLGIAAAPDFTSNILGALSSEEQAALKTLGYYERNHSGLRIYNEFLEDGQKNLVLTAPLHLAVPVILAQGKLDDDVPWQTAERLKNVLAIPSIEIVYIEDGDHRLVRPQDMVLLDTLIQKLS